MAKRFLFDPRSTPGASNEALMRVLERAAKEVARRLQKKAPVSSGRSGPLRRGESPGQPANGLHLRNAFRVRRRGNGFDVVSLAPHALPIIKGSKPHPIEGNPLLAFPLDASDYEAKTGRRVPRRRQAARQITSLRGNGKQTLVVVRRVNHPGHRKNPFFEDVLKQVPGILEKELSKLTQ